MKNEEIFQSSVACLAAIIVLIGFYTQFSLQKMVATYLIGMLIIIGVLLIDWDFFERSVSQWCTPVTVDDLTNEPPRPITRSRFYPVRMAIFTIVYGFGLYKWWMFISSE